MLTPKSVIFFHHQVPKIFDASERKLIEDLIHHGGERIERVFSWQREGISSGHMLDVEKILEFPLPISFSFFLIVEVLVFWRKISHYYDTRFWFQS